MDKQYFKEYFLLERHHWWFRVREKIIRERLVSQQAGMAPLKILNIGAATGRSSEMLAEFGEVTSVEYDPDCFEFTRDNVLKSIIQESILDLPFPSGTFDWVCAFDVIEHVEDDALAISEMKRVCKPGGTVCVTVPASMWLWSRHDVINHHFRRYGLRQLSGLFEGTAGSVLFRSYFNTILFPFIFAYRGLRNLLPEAPAQKGSGSDFGASGGAFADRLLFWPFSLENVCLRYIRFPFGVSIIYLWKKS